MHGEQSKVFPKSNSGFCSPVCRGIICGVQDGLKQWVYHFLGPPRPTPPFLRRGLYIGKEAFLNISVALKAAWGAT